MGLEHCCKGKLSVSQQWHFFVCSTTAWRIWENLWVNTIHSLGQRRIFSALPFVCCGNLGISFYSSSFLTPILTSIASFGKGQGFIWQDVWTASAIRTPKQNSFQTQLLWTSEDYNHRIIGYLGLEGTRKDHQVQFSVPHWEFHLSRQSAKRGLCILVCDFTWKLNTGFTQKIRGDAGVQPWAIFLNISFSPQNWCPRSTSKIKHRVGMCSNLSLCKNEPFW